MGRCGPPRDALRDDQRRALDGRHWAAGAGVAHRGLVRPVGLLLPRADAGAHRSGDQEAARREGAGGRRLTVVADGRAAFRYYEDDLELREVTAQPYENCKISAGFVSGHPVDTLYLKLERDGEQPTIFVFRPDELAA